MAWTDPRTWVAGEFPSAATFNTHVRDNLKAIGDAWTAYTPSWNSTGTQPALGNGTATGFYIAAGDLIVFRFKITLGTTSTVGTGTYSFGLPVAAAATADETLDVTGGLQNTGTAFYPCWGRRFTTSASQIDLLHVAAATGSGAQVTASTPFVPGSTDVFMASGVYQGA